MNYQSSSPTPPALQFIHITDTHLLDEANGTIHGLNPRENLQKILADCESHYADNDFILFTGDISQTGHWKSYCQFKEIIKPYNRPMYCIPGNHDTPDLLQKVIPSSPHESISTIQFGMYSLVLLNSRIENQHQGRIQDASLQQLEQYLSSNQQQLHIIALHHPPIRINSQWLDDLGLLNQQEVMRVIRKHPKPTLTICGHVHQEFDQVIDQHRILVSPSTCHQFTANSDTYSMESTGSGYRMVQINADLKIETRVHRLTE